jgi:uncharacterized protein with PIN domain
MKRLESEDDYRCPTCSTRLGESMSMLTGSIEGPSTRGRTVVTAECDHCDAAYELVRFNDLTDERSQWTWLIHNE